ncbi:MAG TPA: NUDIX domain-containing protein [Gaiellaceae bacterium]|nr:NUDIX domain-containing protein [Gaiellaceae bacterium]
MSELDGWKHCPRCCSEIVIEGGRADCKECGFRTYAGSKPTSSALCVDDDGRVMLSRRGIPPFEGLWDLPGGFLEEGEHPRDGVRRELQEEAGVEIDALELLGIWMDRYGGDSAAVATLNFYWTARIVEGEPEPADDVAEFRWFAPDEVPYDELAFDHLDDVLAALRRQQHA